MTRAVLPPYRSRHLGVALAALWTVLALTLAGCDATPVATDDPEPARDVTPRATPPTPSAPQGLQQFYGQEISWESCDEDFDCGEVEVPLDYADPEGEAIEIALKSLPAGDDDERLGSLVINPGGPGVSGIEYVEQAEAQFGDDVLDHYDVVGFDPRGVAASSPVDCLSDDQLDEFIGADPAPDDAEETEDLLAQTENFGQGCVELSGNVAAHVSTTEVARDLDLIRAALGEPRLDYFGASYGTLLGATYAELFPDNVGRMVLDGAVDPSLSAKQAALDQAAGFQRAAEAYLANCVDEEEDCPLGDTVEEAEQNLRQFLADLDAQPIAGDAERELTQGRAILGVWLPLYVEELWPVLDQALTAAIDEGDGSLLLRLADFYVSREESGYANNSIEALYAINCLDHSTEGSVDEVRASIPEFERVSPIFGEVFAWGALGCGDWPVEAAEPVPSIDAAGADPIVVVGTVRDPATPYEWAVAMAEQLESGVLVSREGDGHTGYGRGNECVDSAVEDYLLDGTVPRDGLEC